jgi:hypothetical protein
MPHIPVALPATGKRYLDTMLVAQIEVLEYGDTLVKDIYIGDMILVIAVQILALLIWADPVQNLISIPGTMLV